LLKFFFRCHRRPIPLHLALRAYSLLALPRGSKTLIETQNHNRREIVKNLTSDPLDRVFQIPAPDFFILLTLGRGAKPRGISLKSLP
jgi:hypothetical protein